MKILKMITGVLFLTSAVAGDATGKTGKYGWGGAELGSKLGKNVSHWVGDTACGMADSWTTNGWTENSPVMQNVADLTYMVSNFSHSAGSFYAGTEKVSQKGKDTSKSLEQSSHNWNKKGKNLLRDHQYRDLKAEDFALDYHSSPVASQLDNDNEDWVLLTEEPETFFDTAEYQE